MNRRTNSRKDLALEVTLLLCKGSPKNAILAKIRNGCHRFGLVSNYGQKTNVSNFCETLEKWDQKQESQSNFLLFCISANSRVQVKQQSPLICFDIYALPANLSLLILTSGRFCFTTSNISALSQSL